MSRTSHIPLATAALIAVLAPAQGLLAYGVQQGPRTAQNSAIERERAMRALRTLADEVWSHQLANSTYLQLQEGAQIEKFEDYTLEEYNKELGRQNSWRKALTLIDPSVLSETDLVTYEILKFVSADVGANEDDYWLSFPMTSYVGVYNFQFLKQALAAQNISDAADAGHYLHLVSEYADILDNLLFKLRGQTERGIYMPKPALTLVRQSWAELRSAVPATLAVEKSRLHALNEVERAEFLNALERMSEQRVTPGFDRLLAAIGRQYEAAAPTAVGLAQYPRGREVYRRLVRSNTTMELSPEEIHQHGLKMVESISLQMKAIRDELGFKGSATAFYDQISRDPRFIASSPKEVEDSYRSYIGRIQPLLGRYFNKRPKAAYGVKRMPPAAEKGLTNGYYAPPTAKEPVGYYYYNASDLPNRSLIGAASLIYHELLPGHHMHLALQMENEQLPPFRRKYFASAFGEGWADYAAGLGFEMGLYQTPYERYGRYSSELFLAIRLVVDTGMNALGWSLEDARAYAMKHHHRPGSQLNSELLRYSTSIPGQALSYRLGSEKMWQLRRRAEQKLGTKFSIREFHDVILMDGTVPLAVLDKKVDRYIEVARRR